jgi:hypothetical protein
MVSNDRPMWVGGQVSTADYGGGRKPFGGQPRTPSAHTSDLTPADQANVIVEPVYVGMISYHAADPPPDSGRIQPNRPPAAVGGETGGGSTDRPAPVDLGGDRSTANPAVANPAPVAPRAAAQTPFMLAGPSPMPAELHGMAVPATSGRPIRDIEIPVTAAPTASQALSTPRTAGGPGDVLPAVETAGSLPDPAAMIAEPLLALPPLDVTALERGLQQFLARLEAAGRDLVGDGDGARIVPWVVAGAATAAACEIARRQLRRYAAERAVDLIPLTVSAAPRHDPE